LNILSTLKYLGDVSYEDVLVGLSRLWVAKRSGIEREVKVLARGLTPGTSEERLA
jgi:hypothetical protein